MRTILGTHVNMDGDLLSSPREAAERDLLAFQMYLSTRGNSWWPQKVDEEIGAAFKELKGERWAAAHAPFVYNILSDPGGYKWANNNWKGLVKQLQRAEVLGLDAVVFHMGSPKELGPEKGFINALWYLEKVLEGYEGSVKLCIENDANPKKDPAGDIPTIVKVVEHFNDTRLGICLDLTHAFAYGYDIANEVIADQVYGWVEPYVEFVHFNQPEEKVTLGSKRDRHASPLDNGPLGERAMWYAWKFFEGKPLILEGTPDFEYDRKIVQSWEDGKEPGVVDFQDDLFTV